MSEVLWGQDRRKKVVCAHCGTERLMNESQFNRNVTGIFFCGNECKLYYQKHGPEGYNRNGCNTTAVKKINLLAEMYEKKKAGGEIKDIREEYSQKLKEL